MKIRASYATESNLIAAFKRAGYMKVEGGHGFTKSGA